MNKKCIGKAREAADEGTYEAQPEALRAEPLVAVKSFVTHLFSENSAVLGHR